MCLLCLRTSQLRIQMKGGHLFYPANSQDVREEPAIFLLVGGKVNAGLRWCLLISLFL